MLLSKDAIPRWEEIHVSITNHVREEKNVLKHFMKVDWFITHLGRQGKKN